MRNVNYLRKRALNIKSQVFEWIKQERILVDLNSQDFYLLEDKPSDDADCKLLPSHIAKLLKKYLEENMITAPRQSSDFATLNCGGMLRSEALFSACPSSKRWVNARKITISRALQSQ